jgi:signal transduction histidine kinase
MMAVQVLDDLLTYEKLESGTLLLKRNQEDVLPLLKKTLRAFKAHAQFAQISIELDDSRIASPTLQTVILVDMDAEKMSRVFTNLLINAVSFTPKGGSVSVSVSMSPDHKLITIEVP